jgi:non-homologous end joining protein Ku
VIGRGERLVLTGFEDALHVRLESFAMVREVERNISWDLLEKAVVDILPQTIGAMREQLNVDIVPSATQSTTSPTPREPEVIDLMDALKRSLAKKSAK